MAKSSDGQQKRRRNLPAFLVMAASTLGIVWVVIALAGALPVDAASTVIASPGYSTSNIEREWLRDFDCTQIEELGIDKMMNLRASQIMMQCGREKPGGPAPADKVLTRFEALISPLAYGGADVPVNNATADTYPAVTQSETFIAVNGTNVVVGFNSSAYADFGNFSGVAYSSNGGATFTEVRPAPFTGYGFNAGDPVMMYKRANNTWYSVWLTYGTGSAGTCSSGGSSQTLGLGMFRSIDNGASWSPASCVHVGTGGINGGDDRESGWIDNNPSSPWYGRIYVAWNNFGAGGALQVAYSDNGVNWSAPRTLSASFIREGQVAGGTDGTVFVIGMNEQGGAGNPRTHIMYRSTNGGDNWSASTMAANQAAPGQGPQGACTNTYFRNIPPIWRYQGLGAHGVGPGGVVHYAYTRHGPGADLGDIYYVRSTNNGVTWSAPIKLNTDAGLREQWMPSLAVTEQGRVLVSWYDRRNTGSYDYERRARVSTDNGATWGADDTLSDGVKFQPVQPDPNVQGCYAGDYDYYVAQGDTIYTTWMDGRILINSQPQQDVYFDKVSLPAVCTPNTYTDVPPGSTFYPFITCLSERSIVGGYGDCTFRPNADITRGQLSKIVSNSAGFNEPVSGQTFTDVPPSDPFYVFIERMAGRGIIGGYADGTFRPGNPATRGQISKIVSNAAGFSEPVSGQTFSDVPPSNPFYEFIERLAGRGIMGGYADGTFRPNNNATRGQTSKIVANTFFPECSRVDNP